VSIYWNLGFALFVFVILLFNYSQKMVGGGDVKLLTVASLWVGIGYALPFAVLLLIFSSVHAISAWLGWARAVQTGSRKRIPFAPSIAGALIGAFVVSFLLDDPSMTRMDMIDIAARGPSLPQGMPHSVDELKRNLGIGSGGK
jgi:Flp pilus assembly protein protease CpaA